MCNTVRVYAECLLEIRHRDVEVRRSTNGDSPATRTADPRTGGEPGSTLPPGRGLGSGVGSGRRTRAGIDAPPVLQSSSGAGAHRLPHPLSLDSCFDPKWTERARAWCAGDSYAGGAGSDDPAPPSFFLGRRLRTVGLLHTASSAWRRLLSGGCPRPGRASGRTAPAGGGPFRGGRLHRRRLRRCPGLGPGLRRERRAAVRPHPRGAWGAGRNGGAACNGLRMRRRWRSTRSCGGRSRRTSRGSASPTCAWSGSWSERWSAATSAAGCRRRGPTPVACSSPGGG